MRIAVIGRSEILSETAERLARAGHEIALVVTAREVPEYMGCADDFHGLAEQLGCPFLRTARIAGRAGALGALLPIDFAVSDPRFSEHRGYRPI